MIETTKKETGDYLVLQLNGEPDFNDIEPLVQQWIQIASETQHHIALDLGSLNNIPNFFTAPLVQLSNTMTSLGKKLILINVQSNFKFILNVVKIDHLFEFAASVNALPKETPQNTEVIDDPHGLPVISDVLQKDNAKHE